MQQVSYSVMQISILNFIDELRQDERWERKKRGKKSSNREQMEPR